MNKKLIIALMFMLSLSLVSSLSFDIEVLEDSYDIGDEVTVRVSGNNFTNMLIYFSTITYDGSMVEFKRLNPTQNNLTLKDDLTGGFMLIPGMNTWEVGAYCKENCSEGVLAEFVFEVLNNSETEIRIITNEDTYCFMKAMWGDSNLTGHVFGKGNVKLFDDFRTITKNETENKTTIVFEDTNKMIEVYNVDVLEVEDKISTINKLELKLEGNGTETVKLNLTSFGEPYFVYIDGVETEFSFTNNILVFTTHFSQKDVTVDYNAPVIPPANPPSGGSSRRTIVTEPCNTMWECTEWTQCINNAQTRICSIPVGLCTPDDTPEQTKECIVEEDIVLSNGESNEEPINGGKTLIKIILVIVAILVIIAIIKYFIYDDRK